MSDFAIRLGRRTAMVFTAAFGVLVPSCFIKVEPLRSGTQGGAAGNGGEKMGGSTGGKGSGGTSGGAMGGLGGGTPASQCGNGKPEAGEECDTSGDSANCDSDCTFIVCGDGHTNKAAGEVCDTKHATEACWTCDKPVPDCPSGCNCEFVASVGSYYAICSSSVQRATAVTNCKAADYDLASLETKAEHDYLRARMTTAALNVYIVGGTDSAKEGTWVWPNGKVFSNGSTAQGGLYTNWLGGSPSGGAAKNSLEVGYDGTWNDIAVTDYRSYACEYAPPR